MARFSSRLGSPGGGVGSVAPGTVASSSTRSARGVNPRQSRSIMKQFQQENERRNQMITAQLHQQRVQQQKLMKQARTNAQRQGASRRAEITEQATQREGVGRQNLISRGLGNTTIQESVSRGIQSDADKQMTTQRDLEAGRVSGLFSQEAGMQIPQGQFQLGGINMQSGGLEDYLRLLQQLGGGLS